MLDKYPCQASLKKSMLIRFYFAVLINLLTSTKQIILQWLKISYSVLKIF